MDIVVVGAGYAGVAAAVQAAQMGARVHLLERTETLLGTGQVGGIFGNNGRRTLEAECRAMGASALWEKLDTVRLHGETDLPDNRHAVLIDVPAAVCKAEGWLRQWGVQVTYRARAVRVQREQGRLLRVFDEQGRAFEGDAFVDAGGSAGPMSVCVREGNGCVMCAMRCPSYGGRVSISALAGGREHSAERRISGSCKLVAESLDAALRRRLQKQGAAVLPLSEPLDGQMLHGKACVQYGGKDYAQQLVLLDTGSVKMMAPFVPLGQLRQVAGLERAVYADPYAGGYGNSVRLTVWAARDNTLRVPPCDNLFCAGERAGRMVGHTEAIVSGTLAGYNAVRAGGGQPLLTLPETLASGALIAQAAQQSNEVLTAAGGIFFEWMQAQRMYPSDAAQVAERVKKAGMEGVFA